MRHSSFVFASALLSLAGVLSLTGTARADEPTAQPPAAAAASEGEKPQKSDEAPDFKKFTLALNPLGVAIGRYSIQGEYMPATHHALTVNPFYAHAPVTVTVNGKDIDAGSLDGFGGELGYRFYTGSKGTNGFFVGPSVIFASYSQSAATGVAPSGSGGSDSFMSYGGAVDIGGQAVIGPGIVVGGGFGLQYTKNSEDIATENLNIASAVIAGGGIRPRFLLALGYAF